jgi:hypothetical protein
MSRLLRHPSLLRVADGRAARWTACVRSGPICTADLVGSTAISCIRAIGNIRAICSMWAIGNIWAIGNVWAIAGPAFSEAGATPAGVEHLLTAAAAEV